MTEMFQRKKKQDVIIFGLQFLWAYISFGKRPLMVIVVTSGRSVTSCLHLL